MTRAAVKFTAVMLALSVPMAWTPVTHGQSSLRSLPPVLSTVSDETGVLTIDQGQRMAAALTDIEQMTGVTIVVVILATTRPESIEAYVQRLINRWRRESKRLDNGRFVFVAVTKEDRELRIVPSEKLAWVLKEIAKGESTAEALALLKRNKYFEAMTTIADLLAQLIADRSRPARGQLMDYTPEATGRWW